MRVTSVRVCGVRVNHHEASQSDRVKANSSELEDLSQVGAQSLGLLLMYKMQEVEPGFGVYFLLIVVGWVAIWIKEFYYLRFFFYILYDLRSTSNKYIFAPL